MGGDLSINGSSSNLDLAKLQNGAEAPADADFVNTVFSTAKLKGNIAQPAPTNSAPATAGTQSKQALNSDLPAFAKLNLPEDAKPQQEINGIGIYAAGGKEKIKTSTMDGQMIIALGETGQRIKIPVGQMQPKGASIVYDGKTIAVRGLKDATIVGLHDDKYKDSGVNNQMLAENCNGCTFDLNDKSNGWSESRDDLVMNNCKSAKVLTGQNNAIVGLNGTNADVSYVSTGGQKANDKPLSDWINKYHTNIAYDDSSVLSSDNRGTVNRDSHDPLIYDMKKTQGSTFEDNSYVTGEGEHISAADLLLKVINGDAKSDANGSKSMITSDYGAKAPKLSTSELVAQVLKIQKNNI